MAQQEIKEPKRAQESIHNRLFSSHKDKQNKLEELIKQYQRKEDLTNTFKPKIITASVDRLKFNTVDFKVKSQTPIAKARQSHEIRDIQMKVTNKKAIQELIDQKRVRL